MKEGGGGERERGRGRGGREAKTDTGGVWFDPLGQQSPLLHPFPCLGPKLVVVGDGGGVGIFLFVSMKHKESPKCPPFPYRPAFQNPRPLLSRSAPGRGGGKRSLREGGRSESDATRG